MKGDITMGVTFAGGTLPNDVFYLTNIDYSNVPGNTGQTRKRAYMDISRQVPTGNSVAPRHWGALACVYLGLPAS
jgi:hypothetical protein